LHRLIKDVLLDVDFLISDLLLVLVLELVGNVGVDDLGNLLFEVVHVGDRVDELRLLDLASLQLLDFWLEKKDFIQDFDLGRDIELDLDDVLEDAVGLRW
jgi:hypothetical protein